MSAVVLYQNMPPLSPEEYQALTDSIREHGIQVPVILDEEGTVIDGHHRMKIADELGVECPRTYRRGLSDTEKRTLALSLNVDRRHLTREQRRQIVAASIIADPDLNNHQHAKRTGVSPHTVATVRGGLESGLQIAKVTEHVGADGKTYPATYAPRVTEHPEPEPEPDEHAKRTGVNHRTVATVRDGLAPPGVEPSRTLCAKTSMPSGDGGTPPHRVTPLPSSSSASPGTTWPRCPCGAAGPSKGRRGRFRTSRPVPHPRVRQPPSRNWCRPR